MLRNKSEKKEKMKDEAYYVKKIEDLRKMNVIRKAPIVEEEDSDARNIYVWSTNSQDEEVRRPSHDALFASNVSTASKDRKCLIVKSSNFDGLSYNSEDGDDSY